MAYTQEQLDNMSDDELMSIDPSTLAFNSEEPANETADTPAESVETTVENENAENIADQVAKDEDNKGTSEGNDTTTEVDKGNDPAPSTVEEPAKQDQKVDEEVKTDEEDPVKAFHAKITAPFKANGREIKVETPEEAIQLMQMGANYSKKMAALKPNLQLMKMLENAGLLTEEKLSFLIDVASKKPEAISKLVQDSGIDPLDISPEKAGEYQPTSYKPSDKSLVLDEVLDELKGSEHYNRTLSIVADTLDEDSKQIVADNPTVLRNLHQHIADGVFDQVWGEVERQKTFGKLTGLSDLEAYRQVGEQLASSGKLQLMGGTANTQSQATAPAKVVVPPKPKQADDSDRRNKRQAAGPTKAATPSSSKFPADFNPLNMSDEDIMKMDLSKFK